MTSDFWHLPIDVMWPTRGGPSLLSLPASGIIKAPHWPPRGQWRIRIRQDNISTSKLLRTIKVTCCINDNGVWLQSLANRIDTMTSCTMARPAVFEPPGPFHLNVGDGYPRTRSQDLASVLRHVVIDQNGNDNPSHHTVLLLMELRANLENRQYSPDACQEPEPESVIWDIDEAMHLSMDFLQTMTDLNGNFRPLVTSCLDLATQIIPPNWVTQTQSP